MPDKAKIWVCQICQREYKFDDHHRCLDGGFQPAEEKQPRADYAYKREYMREYMRRKRGGGA